MCFICYIKEREDFIVYIGKLKILLWLIFSFGISGAFALANFAVQKLPGVCVSDSFSPFFLNFAVVLAISVGGDKVIKTLLGEIPTKTKKEKLNALVFLLCAIIIGALVCSFLSINDDAYRILLIIGGLAIIVAGIMKSSLEA